MHTHAHTYTAFERIKWEDVTRCFGLTPIPLGFPPFPIWMVINFSFFSHIKSRNKAIAKYGDEENSLFKKATIKLDESNKNKHFTTLEMDQRHTTIRCISACKNPELQLKIAELRGISNKKQNLGPYLTPYTKINFKLLWDLNVGVKTIKFQEKNTGDNLHGVNWRIRQDTKAQPI